MHCIGILLHCVRLLVKSVTFGLIHFLFWFCASGVGSCFAEGNFFEMRGARGGQRSQPGNRCGRGKGGVEVVSGAFQFPDVASWFATRRAYARNEAALQSGFVCCY